MDKKKKINANPSHAMYCACWFFLKITIHKSSTPQIKSNIEEKKVGMFVSVLKSNNLIYSFIKIEFKLI